LIPINIVIAKALNVVSEVGQGIVDLINKQTLGVIYLSERIFYSFAVEIFYLLSMFPSFEYYTALL
jgi:hypothetical protein